MAFSVRFTRICRIRSWFAWIYSGVSLVDTDVLLTFFPERAQLCGGFCWQLAAVDAAGSNLLTIGTVVETSQLQQVADQMVHTLCLFIDGAQEAAALFRIGKIIV